MLSFFLAADFNFGFATLAFITACIATIYSIKNYLQLVGIEKKLSTPSDENPNSTQGCQDPFQVIIDRNAITTLEVPAPTNKHFHVRVKLLLCDDSASLSQFRVEFKLVSELPGVILDENIRGIFLITKQTNSSGGVFDLKIPIPHNPASNPSDYHAISEYHSYDSVELKNPPPVNVDDPRHP